VTSSKWWLKTRKSRRKYGFPAPRTCRICSSKVVWRVGLSQRSSIVWLSTESSTKGLSRPKTNYLTSRNRNSNLSKNNHCRCTYQYFVCGMLLRTPLCLSSLLQKLNLPIYKETFKVTFVFLMFRSYTRLRSTDYINTNCCDAEMDINWIATLSRPASCLICISTASIYGI